MRWFLIFSVHASPPNPQGRVPFSPALVPCIPASHYYPTQRTHCHVRKPPASLGSLCDLTEKRENLEGPMGDRSRLQKMLLHTLKMNERNEHTLSICASSSFPTNVISLKCAKCAHHHIFQTLRVIRIGRYLTKTFV